MGVAEVAEALGIHNANIDKQKGLPEPVATIRATRVWDADEIRAFAEERKRRHNNSGGTT